MIVLDSSVMIAHLDTNDQHHGRAVDLLMNAASATFGASVVTIAEVLVGPARAGQLERARGALSALLVEQFDLSGGSAEKLALLRAQSGLRLPDCCVLLAAEERVGSVATFDIRLGRVAMSRGLVTLGATHSGS